MAADESQKKKDVIDEARNEGKTIHFESLMDLCHLKKFGAGASIWSNASLMDMFHLKNAVETKTPKIQSSELYSEAILWKMILVRMQMSEQGSSITNDGSKSHGHYFKTTRMRRTSSWCSIRLHSRQNGRCTIIVQKLGSQNVEKFGCVYQSTNGLNHGPAWKIQSFLLSEICTVIL